jgi:PAS domain-containing protein
MRHVCAWCQAEIRMIPSECSREAPVSHGICDACAVDFEHRKGMDLLALIEELPFGAIAIDTDFRVRGANQQACDLFQDEWVSLLGRPLGRAFGCEHPPQKGEGLEPSACPGCEVHRLVQRSFQTGQGGATVMSRLKAGRSHWTETHTHRIATFRVGDMVGLRIDPLQGMAGSSPGRAAFLT